MQLDSQQCKQDYSDSSIEEISGETDTSELQMSPVDSDSEFAENLKFEKNGIKSEPLKPHSNVDITDAQITDAQITDLLG